MKVKLQERADKLADACIHEFLEEKRKKEDWDRVSLIQDNIPRLNSKVYIQRWTVHHKLCGHQSYNM